MEIEITAQEDNLIVKLNGEFDHHYAEKFRQAIDPELNKGIYENLILDLSNLDFMDSSGLGAILGRYKILSSMKNGEIKVCGLNTQVDKIFELSGLKKIATVYSSIKEII